MNTERFQRVSAIFERVCAAPADQRERLITSLAGDDADLAAEVRALVAIDISVPEYLQDERVGPAAAARAVDAVARATPGDVQHPERVGRYEIRGVLGEGGGWASSITPCRTSPCDARSP